MFAVQDDQDLCPRLLSAFYIYRRPWNQGVAFYDHQPLEINLSTKNSKVCHIAMFCNPWR
jgi:hypothetical protein